MKKNIDPNSILVGSIRFRFKMMEGGQIRVVYGVNRSRGSKVQEIFDIPANVPACEDRRIIFAATRLIGENTREEHTISGIGPHKAIAFVTLASGEKVSEWGVSETPHRALLRAILTVFLKQKGLEGKVDSLRIDEASGELIG